jgi:hypothetical protein
MAKLNLDAGTPIPAHRDGTRSGFALITSVCAGKECTLLHLKAVEASVGDHIEIGGAADRAALFFDLDVETARIEGSDDRASAFLASEGGAWLATWVLGNMDLLRRRFERLKGQEADELPDTRPAPVWKPGGRIFHQELFPYDFAPAIEHRGGLWMIADACCPDPSDGGKEVELDLFGPDGERITVTGELGSSRPDQKDRLGRALWKAVHADPLLMVDLETRRDEIRHAGPFVVGAAYERARLAVREGRSTLEAINQQAGYLQGGAVPVGLIQRLFDVSARLHAARIELEEAWWSWFRVEVRGAAPREAWGLVKDDPWRVCLCDDMAAEPQLVLALADRGAATLEHRRQRLALGLPLLGGNVLPLVDRAQPDGEYVAAGADEVRLAVAIAEALLAAPRDAIDEELTEPRVFEHRVETDTGTIEVRLTASAAEAPWTEEETDDDEDLEGEELEDDDLEGDDEDEDEDGEPSAEEAALEGFTDAALDRGLANDVVLTARSLVMHLASYASEHTGGATWFHEATIARFLEDHAPRKVMLSDEEIDLAPAALHAVCDWLGEMGHTDAGRLRSTIDRALPVFREQARDPRNFSMAKALFSEMRSAGVDLEDQAAVDRFIAVKNARLAARAPARTQMFAPPEIPARPASPASPAEARVSHSPNRWKPAPGEPLPAPTDPCGCGSGRRYKKCCMPR